MVRVLVGALALVLVSPFYAGSAAANVTSQCGATSESVVTSSTVTQCYECGVGSALCPPDACVDGARAFRGPCAGSCFSTRDTHHPEQVARGCSTTQWGMPDPLPEEGCYTWAARNQTWCFCPANGCNAAPPGEPTGENMRDFIAKQQQEKQQQQTERDNAQGNITAVLPPSYHKENGSELQCWQCQSYSKGVQYSACPLYGRVDAGRAYIGDCGGRCFYRNMTDEDGTGVMVRGCTTTQGVLPTPLPPDGCYRWRGGEVWCLCMHDGCNGLALGTPGENALDFLQKGKGTNRACSLSGDYLPFLLALTVLAFGT